MDKFTRNYSIALGLIALALFGLWLCSLNPRVWELNDMLEADPQLAAYPYPFRVVSLENGVATLGSPRSFEVPVVKFLGILKPGLARKSQDDPAMVAAQEELATHQKRAAQLVLDQPDVQRVSWTLDRDWYAERGINLP